MKPRLAIVTRTKDREVTLRRTAASVAAQTCKDLMWVLVNDGGARTHVDRIADQVREAGIRVTVVHNEISQGRPAAANIGIGACDCPLLVLLDDDDTQDPTFAQECLTFLDRTELPCEGVAVWTDIIHERIEGEKILFIEHIAGYHPENVPLLSLFYTNCFPPSAFVFSRRGWEAAGGFDSRLHCSEDWFFNQHFIKFGRIGVVPKVLTYLHYRKELLDYSSPYSNTMVAGTDDHARYHDYWRDELIRKDLNDKRLGMGELNILAHMFLRSEQIANSTQRIEAQLAQNLIIVQHLESELATYRDLGQLGGALARRALPPYRALRSFASRYILQPLRKVRAIVPTRRATHEPTVAHPQCAVCGAEFDEFTPLPDMYVQYTEAGGRFSCADLEMLAVDTHHCPACYCADRDRLAGLFFRAEFADRAVGNECVMEFAPYPAFSAFLRSLPNLKTLTCDLFMEGVDYKGDITNLSAIREATFNYVVCSHVLEHVEDDLAAMKELWRILVPGGKAVIIVPIYLPLKDCYENPVIVAPDERLKHFGQPDHVRLYSRDCLVSRLTTTGFQVSTFGIEQVGREAFRRNGLTDTARLYIAVKHDAGKGNNHS